MEAMIKLTTARYNIHLPSAVSSHTVALLAWWATFCKITSAMYLPVRATEIAIHTGSNVHKVKLEQGTELCQWLHCNARSLLTLWPHELCVEWGSTNTSKSTFIMWEIFCTHTKCAVEENGKWECLNGCGIYGLDGWGSYGKVSYCFLGYMLKKCWSSLAHWPQGETRVRYWTSSVISYIVIADL